MAYITKQQLQQILQNAPPEEDKVKLVKDLQLMGNEIEGLSKSQLPSSQEDPNKKTVGGFVGNVFKSTGNLVKNTAEAVLHPIQTVKSLGKVALGAAEKVVPGEQGAETDFNQVADFFKERYGSVDKLKETIYNDPAGFAADVSTVLGLGGGALNLASKAGKVGEISSISKLGSVLSKASEVTNPFTLATKPVTKVAGMVNKTTAPMIKYAVSQLSGLSQDSMKTIIETASQYTPDELMAFTREGVFDEFNKKLNTRIEDLRETGKEYGNIRKSGQVATGEPDWLAKSLQKNGYSDGAMAVDDSGQVRVGLKPTRTALLTQQEQSSLQKFMDIWGSKDSLSADEFLDGRKFLDDLSDWKAGSSSDEGTRLFRDLRKDFDSSFGKNVKGLKELDEKFAPERTTLGKLKKDYFNPDGTPKDTAINKLASSTNAGKDEVLARAMKIDPEIGRKVQIVKAVEDIVHASSQKVGTYMRAGLGIGGLATLNPNMIIAAALLTPENAVHVLRAYGRGLGLENSALNQITNSIKQTTVNMKSKIKNVTLPAYQAGRIREVTNP